MRLNTRRKKKTFKKSMSNTYTVKNKRLVKTPAWWILTKNERVWVRKTEGRMTNVFQVNEIDFVAAHTPKQAIRWYNKKCGYAINEMIDDPRKVNLTTEFMYVLDHEVTPEERKHCISITSENHDEEVLAMPYWLALRHYNCTEPQIIASSEF